MHKSRITQRSRQKKRNPELYPPEFEIPKEPLKLEKGSKKPQNGRTQIEFSQPKRSRHIPRESSPTSGQ